MTLEDFLRYFAYVWLYGACVFNTYVFLSLRRTKNKALETCAELSMLSQLWREHYPLLYKQLQDRKREKSDWDKVLKHMEKQGYYPVRNND